MYYNKRKNDENCKCIQMIPCIPYGNIFLGQDWIATRARVRTAYKIKVTNPIF